MKALSVVEGIVFACLLGLALTVTYSVVSGRYIMSNSLGISEYETSKEECITPCVGDFLKSGVPVADARNYCTRKFESKSCCTIGLLDGKHAWGCNREQ